MPARNELTAGKTFPAFTAAPTLLQLEARLTLADFTRTDEYNLDALALITRASTGNVLWNADGSRFGGADVLDAGEIGLGVNNAPITRIRNPSANRIQFQDDNTAFSLSDYFIVDEGQDALITFQTIDGAVSFEVNGNIAASPSPNPRRITFETPAALDTLLASLAVTDSLIIAVELPVPRHDLDLGETFPVFTHVVSLSARIADRKVFAGVGNVPGAHQRRCRLRKRAARGSANIPRVHQRRNAIQARGRPPSVAGVSNLPRRIRRG